MKKKLLLFLMAFLAIAPCAMAYKATIFSDEFSWTDRKYSGYDNGGYKKFENVPIGAGGFKIVINETDQSSDVYHTANTTGNMVNVNEWTYFDYKGGENNNAKISGAKKGETYDVEITSNHNGRWGVRVTLNTPAKPVAPSTLYMHVSYGDGNWPSNGQGKVMTKTSDGIFTITDVPVNAKEDAFFIFTSNNSLNWNDNVSTRYGSSINNEYIDQTKNEVTFSTLTQGSKNCWKAWLDNECLYDITVNFNNNQVKYVKKAAYIPSSLYLMVGGQKLPMTVAGANVFKTTYTVSGTTNFYFQSENGTNIGAPSSNKDIVNRASMDIVNNTTNSWKATENGEYTIIVNFNTRKVTYSWTKVGSLKPNTTYVYFNAGADFYTWAMDQNDGDESAVQVRAYFYNGNSPSNYNDLTGWRNYDARLDLMDKADSPIFAFEVPSGYSHVVFHGGNGNNYYDSQKNPSYQDNGETIYRNPYYEADNWTKYIYGPGEEQIAYQSYITIDQYYNLRAKKGVNGVNYIGKGMKVGKTLVDLGNWNQGDLKKDAKDSDGIYVTTMQSNNNISEFKVSYIDPNNQKSGIGNANEKNTPTNRWWATFNLGIIGAPAKHYSEEAPTGKDMRIWHRGSDNYFTNENKEKDSAFETDIEATLNQTVPYNHYNQYNWLLRKQDGKNLWFVVDTKYNSAAILDYDPVPTLDGTPGELKRNAFAKDNEYEATDHPGSYMDGSEYYAEVIYGLYNTLPVDITCTPGPDKSENVQPEQYTLYYELMNQVKGNYNLLKEINRSTGMGTFTTRISSMPLDRDKLFVRATYTDKKNYDQAGEYLMFRSRVGNTTVEGDFDLTALQNIGITKAELHNYGKDNGMLDLVLGVKYEFHESHPFSTAAGTDNEGAAVYPGFEVYLVDADNNKIEGKDGYVIDGNYEYTKFNTDAKNELLGGFEWGADAVDGAVNYTPGWCTKSAMSKNENSNVAGNCEGFLPLFIPDAIEHDAFVKYGQTLKVCVQLYAVYPFKFDQGTAAALVRSKDGVATIANDDITPFSVESEPYYEVLDYDKNISGITDVTVEGEPESFELFNLQGVRVIEANPAPGIYIRRAADGTASKVVIR